MRRTPRGGRGRGPGWSRHPASGDSAGLLCAPSGAGSHWEGSLVSLGSASVPAERVRPPQRGSLHRQPRSVTVPPQRRPGSSKGSDCKERTVAQTNLGKKENHWLRDLNDSKWKPARMAGPFGQGTLSVSLSLSFLSLVGLFVLANTFSSHSGKYVHLPLCSFTSNSCRL